VLDATAGYLEVVNDLKRLIRANQQRVFTFVMGKLNVAKMANFAEVDVFVLVASPENSLLDSKVRRDERPQRARPAAGADLQTRRGGCG